MYPLPTSHQDTNLELQMVLYRLLAGTKTKMYLSPWLKTPKKEKSWCMTLRSWTLSKASHKGLFLHSSGVHKVFFLHSRDCTTNQTRRDLGFDLRWGRAFCRPGVPSHKAANTFFLICNKAGTPQSDPATFRWPRATRYMRAGLWPWLPDRLQHFLGELVVTPCKNWAGFSSNSWVSGSPCTSLPHGWHCERAPARELNMICTEAADLLH